MLRSSNVVAEEMAGALGRTRFMAEMNAKAKALNMYATHFDDASGLSEKNASTAWDLFHMARYLHEKKAFLLAISRAEEKTIVGARGRKWAMDNQNKFAPDPMFVGGRLPEHAYPAESYASSEKAAEIGS
jgi:D-alanyl-D-alanine carboxypeptidase